MIDTKLAQALVEEIFRSPEFKDSERYRELLQYLLNETIAGRAPKEITIGMQFFGKDSSFDPKEDPTVRVYLNNLRKKLDHFYLTHDQPLAHKLEIPKGHYKIQIVPLAPKHDPKPAQRRQKQLITLLALALVAATTTIVALLLTREAYLPAEPPSRLEPSPVWSEYLGPKARPTLVVLGDFYFLFERGSGDKLGNFVRDVRLNSSADYRKMIQADPKFQDRYIESEFTFLRPSASFGLSKLLPILEKAPSGYTMKLASQFNVDDMKTHNVIFIGSFKSLFELQKLVHVFDLEYTLSPASFRVLGGGTDSARTFLPSEIKGGEYERDYGIVAKGKGLNEGTLMLLLGFSEIGVLEAVNAATDQSMLRRIEDELVPRKTAEPLYFTLVLESEGLNQSIFKASVKQLVRRYPR